jgi:hypothetical protein
MVSGTRPTRADYYNALASSLPTQALVVTSLGNASYLWAVVHHAPENFYIEDAMGLALAPGRAAADRFANACRAAFAETAPKGRCSRRASS